ncbi:hypothetical protein PC39_08860 [Salinisphaera sp. PC39]|uniref:WS/DGAT/MGAT family O-acyltransferase n=1 Tax=Salinisphaera sp. PC39 TaxID=1304156 RepID=UPI003340EE89
MSKRLRMTDGAWFLAESPSTPVHVGCLAICTRPAGAGPDYLRDLVRDWGEVRRYAPPFNYRYRAWPVPHWQELADADIDLDYHLRHSALPRPGGERELGVLVSRLHSHALDRSRPFWECHVIEGLEGDRFALYMKMHHSQIDGIGGIRLMERMMSPDPDVRGHEPPWAIGMATGGGTGKGDTAVGGARLREAVRGTRALAGVFGRLGREAVTDEHPETAVPFEAPMTILNGRINAPRRFATQHYALARLRAVADVADVTVNDVFLAICAGALRRYLDEQGALPGRTLTAALPVSVRPADDHAMGNAISFILAKLATDEADPGTRLRAIHASTTAAKGELQRLPRSAMDPYTMLYLGPYLTQIMLGLGGYTRPMHNVVISNVPGPRERLYFNGARMEQIYPVSLLLNGQALNISVVSYAGRFNLGYTGCRDSLPHMQRLAVYTGEALEELEAAVGVAAPGPDAGTADT